jgi:hypothetical protein
MACELLFVSEYVDYVRYIVVLLQNIFVFYTMKCSSSLVTVEKHRWRTKLANCTWIKIFEVFVLQSRINFIRRRENHIVALQSYLFNDNLNHEIQTTHINTHAHTHRHIHTHRYTYSSFKKSRFNQKNIKSINWNHPYKTLDNKYKIVLSSLITCLLPD